jgi:hypothetical protein
MRFLRLAALSVFVAQLPTLAPTPIPAVDGVIEALRSNQLVAISDPHGSSATRSFIRQLIADPRFATLVDDIVVEIGNARHQSLVDDYVGGRPVTEAALADVWLNTTVANQIAADVEWFKAVRRINRLRPERPMRILLGDPPIDWTKVRTRDDHFKWLSQRDSFPAALIQTEVIARERKALIVYGHLHFQRRQMMSNFFMDDWRAQTIVSLIERAGPTRVHTIWKLGEELTGAFPAAKAWPHPALVNVKGTSLGALDMAQLYPKALRAQIVDGVMKPVSRDAWAPMAVEQQLDAVLYLGDGADDAFIDRPVEVCARPGFLEERLRRIALTGIPRFEADAIQSLCAPR